MPSELRSLRPRPVIGGASFVRLPEELWEPNRNLDTDRFFFGDRDERYCHLILVFRRAREISSTSQEGREGGKLDGRATATLQRQGSIEKSRPGLELIRHLVKGVKSRPMSFRQERLH